MHGANLGTLLRTCDAVGACLAVPRLPWVPEALARGNTLRRPACVHWTGRDPCQWLLEQRSAGSRIVGVELADEAIRLADLPRAKNTTIRGMLISSQVIVSSLVSGLVSPTIADPGALVSYARRARPDTRWVWW
jgi:hypothetical protein